MSLLATEQLKVEMWKIEQFERLGCTHYLATLLNDRNIDWHEVARVMKKGATLVQALEIVA